MFNKKTLEELTQVIKMIDKNISEQCVEIQRKIEENENNIIRIKQENINEIKNSQMLIQSLCSQIENINQKIECIEKNSNEILNNINLKFMYSNPELTFLENTNKTKILITGFYGAENLGDELMLETLLNYFDEHKSKISLTIMLANNLDYDIFKYQGINFIHYPKSKFDYNILANYYDIVIFGGGALIDDKAYSLKENGEMTLSTTLIELSRAMLFKNKDVYWIGLSTNSEIKDKSFVSKLKYIIDNITYISLRDTNSLQSLKESNINTQNVDIVNDIILASPLLKQKYPNKLSKSSVNIGVILICFNELTEIFNKSFIEELIRYTENENININFIPFYNYRQNDKLYLANLSKKYENKVQILDYPDSLSKSIEIFNQQDYIISMRYHGSLLALALKKPLLSIIWDKHPHYNNKMGYLYQKYSLDDNVLKVSNATPQKIEEALEKLIRKKNKSNKINDKILQESEITLKNIVDKIVYSKIDNK